MILNYVLTNPPNDVQSFTERYLKQILSKGELTYALYNNFSR